MIATGPNNLGTKKGKGLKCKVEKDVILTKCYSSPLLAGVNVLLISALPAACRPILNSIIPYQPLVG